MNQIRIFLTLLTVGTTIYASAQSQKQPVLETGSNLSKNAAHEHHAPTLHSCGNEMATAKLLQNHPEYAQQLQQLQHAIEMVSRRDDAAMRTPQVVIEIPVVVHVIHQGEAVGTGRNISDARIIGQLNTLNNDFRKQNANWASGTPAIFQAVGADTEIHFCLARTNPTGGTTTGIDRQQMTVTGTSTSNSNIETATTGVKAVHKWDPTRYLNVYVLPIPGTSALGGVIGYSYLPMGGVVGTYQDGIVLDYRWFGQTGQAGLSGGGRSLTHECGHYFGLPHIWANTSNTGGCSADDGIADTPEQNDATSNNAAFNCSSGVPPVSCGTQNMYVNYMDYLDDDACYTQYTAGQKAVMRSVLTGTGGSFGLTNRTALVNNGLTQCASCTMTAATSSIVNLTCSTPGSATATATNVPAGNTATYAWSNGATTAAVSTTVAGTFTVTITANTTCMATATAVIANTCTTFCDTLSNYNVVVDSARLYRASAAVGSGFVAGNNTFGDLAKADYFDYSAGAHSHIKGFYMAFGYAKDVAPVTTINMRVWNANGTGGIPSTILATKTASLTAIRTAILAQQYVQYYEFATPIALPAGKKFYIGVELPTTTGDTLALITNQTGAMTVGTGTAWEKWSDGTWHNYNAATTWGLDLAHLISPVLGTPTTAAFTPATTTIACNTPAVFNSTSSTNAAIRSWTFTGGTPTTSSAVSPSVSFAAAGTYTVQLITQNGCLADTAVGTVTVTCASCTLAATTTSVATTCNLANGSATITPTGGTTPYTYAWNNGGTTATISNIVAGTYTVTVSGGVGCTRSATVVVASSIGIAAATTSATTRCNLANGSATVTATGSTSPYSYAWSNAGTTATISNIAAGTYTVTVTGGVGCTKTATVSVAASVAITAAMTSVSTTCNLVNGSATATATGGTAPYTYAWSNAGTTATINNIAAGTYTVTVTGGAGCTKSATVVVASSAAITATTTSTATSCNLANGSATVTASGGTTYTYAWSNAATTATISAIAAGTYTVTVTAGAGCTKTATVVVASSAAIAAATSSTPTTCNLANGSANVTATGGATPYAYAWSNGGTTPSINSVVAGVYTVTVTGGVGCTKTATVSIASSVGIAATTTVIATTCGAANGSATAVATGGTSYTYAWSNTATTATISNLASGVYTVTVTSGGGCTRTATASIASSTSLNTTLSSTPTSCNLANGTAAVAATGGATPYSYAWSNGGTTGTISTIPAGIYTVTVTAGAGCTRTATVSVASSTALLATATSAGTTCALANGTATASAIGGATPYSYGWSNGAISANIANLSPGTYTVTVIGGVGCTNIATAVIISSNALTLSATTTATQQGQNTGSATAAATGTSPYNYAWSNGATTATINNLAAGTYTATATDARGCTATTTAVVTTIIATTDLKGMTNLTLYPNPTANELCVSIDFDAATFVDMTLTNALGQAVFFKEFWVQSHLFHTINTHELPASTYFLSLKTENGQTVRKVFVVH